MFQAIYKAKFSTGQHTLLFPHSTFFNDTVKAMRHGQKYTSEISFSISFSSGSAFFLFLSFFLLLLVNGHMKKTKEKWTYYHITNENTISSNQNSIMLFLSHFSQFRFRFLSQSNSMYSVFFLHLLCKLWSTPYSPRLALCYFLRCCLGLRRLAITFYRMLFSGIPF